LGKTHGFFKLFSSEDHEAVAAPGGIGGVRRIFFVRGRGVRKGGVMMWREGNVDGAGGGVGWEGKGWIV